MANIIGATTINQTSIYELDGNPLSAPTPGISPGDLCVVYNHTGVWQKTGQNDSDFVQVDAWTAFGTQPTTSGTITLDASSNAVVVFTGSTAGTVVKLPDATTLIRGWQYMFFNDSNQTVAVKNYSNGAIYSVIGGSRLYLLLIDNSSAAGVWTYDVTLPAGGVAPHASTHSPQTGSDPLATAAPVSVGDSNTEGSADAFSRADHVHDHGTHSSGTNHAVATSSVSGFMASGDKSKLDKIATKAGRVLNSAFTGSPKRATVTFTTGFASSNYSVNITGVDTRVWSVESQTVNGFVINSNANLGLTGDVQWQAELSGEL